MAARDFPVHASGPAGARLAAHLEPARDDLGSSPSSARLRCPGHPLPDGGDVPRLLLAQLTAPVWKALHMGSTSPGAARRHVALGALQTSARRSPPRARLGPDPRRAPSRRRCASGDRPTPRGARRDGYVEVCGVDEIAEKRAKVSRSAASGGVFRYDGQVSALSNVCQHQNGPLGEGGSSTAASPALARLPVPARHGRVAAPLHREVPTFRVRLAGGGSRRSAPLPAAPSSSRRAAPTGGGAVSRRPTSRSLRRYLPVPPGSSRFLRRAAAGWRRSPRWWRRARHRAAAARRGDTSSASTRAGGALRSSRCLALDRRGGRAGTLPSCVSCRWWRRQARHCAEVAALAGREVRSRPLIRRSGVELFEVSRGRRSGARRARSRPDAARAARLAARSSTRSAGWA